MISRIGVTSYNRAFNNINKNVSKTAAPAPKAISFGELDDCGNWRHSYSGSSKRDRIENNYNKRLQDLAEKADDIDMDNTVYYQQVRKIEADRDKALYDYDNLFPDENY